MDPRDQTPFSPFVGTTSGWRSCAGHHASCGAWPCFAGKRFCNNLTSNNFAWDPITKSYRPVKIWPRSSEDIIASRKTQDDTASPFPAPQPSASSPRILPKAEKDHMVFLDNNFENEPTYLMGQPPPRHSPESWAGKKPAVDHKLAEQPTLLIGDVNNPVAETKEQHEAMTKALAAETYAAEKVRQQAINTVLTGNMPVPVTKPAQQQQQHASEQAARQTSLALSLSAVILSLTTLVSEAQQHAATESRSAFLARVVPSLCYAVGLLATHHVFIHLLDLISPRLGREPFLPVTFFWFGSLGLVLDLWFAASGHAFFVWGLFAGVVGALVGNIFDYLTGLGAWAGQAHLRAAARGGGEVEFEDNEKGAESRRRRYLVWPFGKREGSIKLEGFP